MDILIKPEKLKGSINIIESKSDAHRVLICACLSDKKSRIYLSNRSKDIMVTIDCLRTLGATIDIYNDYIDVFPIIRTNNSINLDFNESGSTCRFLIPITTAIYNKASFSGNGRLPNRPIKDLLTTLEANGADFSSYKLPMKNYHKLKSGNFSIPGNISSQYISGLILASPLLEMDCIIDITTNIESKKYIDMTINTMKKFNINVLYDKKSYYISKNSYYSPKSKDFYIEGDWSNASFFIVAAALGADITIGNLSIDTVQGDIKILEILERFNVYHSIQNGYLSFTTDKIKATTIDISQTPDLLPILAVFATKALGVTKFINGKRLRLKESDRLKTSQMMINNLGGKAEIIDDNLIVYGTNGLLGGKVNSYNDHRIAMSASIASVISKKDIIIEDAKSIEKSYINFYDEIKSLGGDINVI